MKVAILGTWHVHADDYVKAALRYGEVVGVYEENGEWRRNFAHKYGIPEFSSAEELFASDAEGVIICTATSKHPKYMMLAAENKKHIFTEKVLALTLEDCLRVKKAVEDNDVRFTISFPWKFRSCQLTVKKAIDDGLIGKVNYFRFRNCHNGSLGHWLPAHFYNKDECGGGAMIDLGAHGMYLAHWLLGLPQSYSSSFTHFCRDEEDGNKNPSGLEDNAVTVMTYGSGAIAVNETGFVSVGSKAVMEVGGELGYITACDGKVLLYNDKNGLPAELELCPETTFPLGSFLCGEDVPGCGIDDAVALTEMMIGAYKNVLKL